MAFRQAVTCCAIVVLAGVLVDVGRAGNGDLETGPVLHFTLDDGSPSAIAGDDSGHGLDGTLTNMDPATDWVDGIDDRGLDFDGNDDFVEVVDDPLLDFGTSDFSVSMWYYKRATSSGVCANVFGAAKWRTGAAPGTNEWTLSIGRCGGASASTQTDQVGFAIESGSATYTARSPADVSLNEWHHLVGVRRDESLTLYLDGSLVGQSGDMPCDTAVNDAGRRLRLARNQNTGLLLTSDVIIDQVQIYRFALTDGGVGDGETAGGEIATLFQTPSAVVSRPPPTTTTTLVACPAMCGDANQDGNITATDALLALNAAVGQQSCVPCICDVNDSGTTTATDALAILRFSVGALCDLRCPGAG